MTLSKKQKEERRIKKYNKTHRINKNGKIEKLCSICGKWLLADLENFYSNNLSPDKLFPDCKKCELKRRKIYNREHKKEQKERHRKWHIKNRESEIKKKLEYNREHFEYKKEYAKKWRRSENGRKIMRYHSKKYSKKAHRITKNEWKCCKNYFINDVGEQTCAYCGITISEHKQLYNQDFHKEHVYYDGRNDLKNCIPSCKRCNTSKHQDSFNDWYNFNNPVYTYERYHKICQWIHFDCKK